MTSRLRDSVLRSVNFQLQAFDRGKKVPGLFREGHNVLTNAGADWLADLVGWKTLGGAGDVAYTNRRVRWMGIGTGSQAEVPGVTGLVSPTIVAPGTYLAAIQETQRPTAGTCIFIREFAPSEVSIPDEGLSLVTVSEAGLFADVYPVSVAGGDNDGAVGAADTAHDPTSSANAPIAYHAFEPVTKTVDISFRIEWTFLFE